MKKLTACKDCKYLSQRARDMFAMWYDMLCGAVPPIESFDAFTGETEATQPYCRDINTDGHCPHFEAKTP